MSALKKLGVVLMESYKHQTSENQAQTRETFGFKWSKRDTYDSAATKANTYNWLIEKYCNNNPDQIDEWLKGGRKIILDAGCGAGFSGMVFWGDRLHEHDYIGVDISNSIEMAKIRFQEADYPGEFLKRSLLDLEDIPEESIDIIFSEGVLHHTDNTEQSIKYLSKKIRKNGRFLFYVYAKKAVIREFTDDHIRDQISHLSDEDAWNALEPLTELGIALGELNIDLSVQEDIPYLGIKKGKLDLQRFFYWNICKLYYRPEYSKDEMTHINFDWFRPLNCHRHSPEEIKLWCAEAGMEIEHINVQGVQYKKVQNKQHGSKSKKPLDSSQLLV